ncbi:MAG: bifunctional acetate--CoA ligase family protein/GNAT family N-acetyltransferase [Planctomycetota bacterium]|jgi:acetyl coenzyme A synthetase (ADP forming)-like protein
MGVQREPLILSDGTSARVRRARPTDAEFVAAFIERIAGEAGGARPFLSPSREPLSMAEVCDASDPRRRLTLLAIRTVGTEDRIVGAAGYRALDERTAEIGLGVDETFRGKGLATRLVERLAVAAAHHGFVHFKATADAGHRALLEVLRRSGFPQAERQAEGVVEFDFTVMPHAEGRRATEMRDRVATATSIRPFFHPRAVAVIGASRDPASLGYRTLHALVVNRFQGPVYAVNPHATSIGSFPSFPSVAALPTPVDLAIILVPKQHVAAVVDDCAAGGVRAVVVITAGFAETGEEGKRRQRDLLKKVRGYGMRMVGPNCMGLLNAEPDVRLTATFSPILPPAGNVAMSSQSGALGLAVLAAADQLGIGLSTFVSVGNKADVSGNDLIEYWEEDDRTEVILLYVESFGNPRRFARIARRVGRSKPIVAVKSGRTGAGKRAAGSHTAALAGSDVAVDALFRQTGVIRAGTMEEMFDLALLLSSQPLPRGRRVGVVTNAGGPAILCADACEGRGLEITELSKALRAELASFLPAEASTTNPVDMIASAGAAEYRRAVGLLLDSDEVDALVVIYAPIDAADLAPVEEAIHEAMDAAEAPCKPVVAVLMGEGGRGMTRGLRRGVPCYQFPEAAARVLGTVADYAAWRERPPGQPVELKGFDVGAARDLCRRVLAERGAGWLSASEAREVLGTAGLPLLEERVALDSEEAVRAAEAIGFPVALKLVSRTLVHKTDVGGVELDVPDAKGVRDAVARIRARLAEAGQANAFEGVLVQPMLAEGVEVMAGMTEDPVFGPLVAFGLGGIHVEVLGDTVFRVAPLTDQDAAEMVNGIRGRPLLEGFRGHPPADKAALEDLLLRVSRLAEDVPEIDDFDLNPVFALAPGQGCRIVDARIHVAPTSPD